MTAWMCGYMPYLSERVTVNVWVPTLFPLQVKRGAEGERWEVVVMPTQVQVSARGAVGVATKGKTTGGTAYRGKRKWHHWRNTMRTFNRKEKENVLCQILKKRLFCSYKWSQLPFCLPVAFWDVWPSACSWPCYPGSSCAVGNLCVVGKIRAILTLISTSCLMDHLILLSKHKAAV